MEIKLIFLCKKVEMFWKKITESTCHDFSDMIHYECRQIQTSVYKQNKLITNAERNFIVWKTAEEW